MKQLLGFSLAEALITLLIVCIIAIASAPVITRKHRAMANSPHGSYACYWRGDALVAKYEENKHVKDGKVVFDEQEGRYGCEFEPPKSARNFVVTIVGGGGGGAGSAIGAEVINLLKEKEGELKTGIYDFLFVGNGGRGGNFEYTGDYNYKPKMRAYTGAAGAVLYIPSIKISHSTTFRAFGNYFSMMEGGSYILTFNPDTANGPGLKYYYQTTGSYDEQKAYKMTIESTAYGGGDFFAAAPIELNSTTIYGFKDFLGHLDILINKYGGISGYKYDKRIVEGKPMQENRYGSKDSGTLLSSVHQNYEKYNNNKELEQYSKKFGIEFNKPVKSTNYAYYIDKDGKMDSAKQNSECGGEKWKTNPVCRDYENNYGAGGGGQGIHNNVLFTDGIPGKEGIMLARKIGVYAGLGGEAGSMSQTTYQIMNQKIVMFPGKGGKGGQYSTSIAKTDNGYTGNEETAGESGQSSYIKNSSEVLGGKGASGIYPGNESTYSAFSDKNTSTPIGGNGKLAVAPKEGLTGGLGGYNGTNNTFNGLTQTVFKNDAQLGTVSTITGAGSGGGGGALLITKNGDNYNIDQGTGGQGASGLVFIQW